MEMHQRKIQSFAKYSYAVTLPIHWIKKNHLEKKEKNGSSKDPAVNIFENPDGSLGIFPLKEKIKSKEQIFLLELDDLLKQNPNIINEKGISLILISYYMNGASGIEIQSKQPIPKEFIDQIEKTQTRLLFNWNLNRVSSRKLLIKNIFSETPENIFQEEIPRYLRESFSILLWMLEDILTAMENEDYSNLQEIEQQDQKIDRYYFFIVRQIRTIFENPQISKPLNYSHKKLIDLRLLAKLIEDVGDSLKEIASTLFEMNEFFNEIALRDFLIQYFKSLLEIYSELADHIRKNVVERAPAMGLNNEMMQLIQKFRFIGEKLQADWFSLAPKLGVIEDKHTFMEYYKGARLVGNLEDIFKNVFDFTNIFF
ncbi:PhoU domain-containing protein [Candidatus Lokiarchaeum ossiferum]|uniref:PhoU domain-containing protein n=1 Tax=Candidatus Lokiarchaeum ossiferum TaxID=2951803 RepID=UPI00352BF458